ncbi:hypothetical protein J6590_043674 [Homalodisca vitripennis]|nr:hypothetical protein J6590_043674 [Homalodisca vitripennis]
MVAYVAKGQSRERGKRRDCTANPALQNQDYIRVTIVSDLESSSEEELFPDTYSSSSYAPSEDEDSKTETPKNRHMLKCAEKTSHGETTNTEITPFGHNLVTEAMPSVTNSTRKPDSILKSGQARLRNEVPIFAAPIERVSRQQNLCWMHLQAVMRQGHHAPGPSCARFDDNEVGGRDKDRGLLELEDQLAVVLKDKGGEAQTIRSSNRNNCPVSPMPDSPAPRTSHALPNSPAPQVPPVFPLFSSSTHYPSLPPASTTTPIIPFSGREGSRNPSPG